VVVPHPAISYQSIERDEGSPFIKHGGYPCFHFVIHYRPNIQIRDATQKKMILLDFHHLKAWIAKHLL